MKNQHKDPDQHVSPIIEEEQAILKTVIESLDSQFERALARRGLESSRARELTSEIVQSRRVEEKAMLASDEAVSHALVSKQGQDLATLKQLRNKPYFARLALEEEEKGEVRLQEFKIGFAANPDCRIIDWRKAPVSRLYYEYKEGEEYSEEIQGRERHGRIKLRNSLEIENGHLKKISCSLGTFLLKDGIWETVTGAGSSAHLHRKGSLPHILSLITAEQFKIISEDSGVPVLLHGVAGSGKTTVALHRLGYLLHKDNAGFRPEDCLILVLSGTLKTYIESTLPAMQIFGVPVQTLDEFCAAAIGRQFPQVLCEDGSLRRPQDKAPSSLERLMRSMALLSWLESAWNSESLSGANALEQLISLLRFPDEILARDETRLLDKDLIHAGCDRLSRNCAENSIDHCADSLALRIIQLSCPAESRQTCSHIVVDEIQDFSPVDLACVLSAVSDARQLTLAGDTAQALSAESSFPGWEKLKSFWPGRESISRVISLDISHRSTLPIMRLAEHVQGRQLVKTGREGRVPIWFKCRSERLAVEAAIKWLNQAVTRYPDALTCVICRDQTEARYLAGLLQPTFGPSVRLGFSDLFSFEEGISVSEIAQIRGLEFVNVLFWNPSEKSYPSGDMSRNLIYIGITRAQENLCLITHSQPASPLRNCPRGMLRVVSYGDDQ